MNIQQIFMVRDDVSDSYLKPFIVPSEAVLVRSFAMHIADAAAEDPLAQYPEHYSVWHVGEVDFVSGELSVVPRRFVGNVETLVQALDRVQSRQGVNEEVDNG